MVFNCDNNRVEVDGGGDNCDNRVEMMLLLWRRCCAEVISVGCHLTVATVATVATVVVCQPIIVLKTVYVSLLLYLKMCRVDYYRGFQQ